MQVQIFTVKRQHRKSITPFFYQDERYTRNIFDAGYYELDLELELVEEFNPSMLPKSYELGAIASCNDLLYLRTDFGWKKL